MAPLTYFKTVLTPEATQNSYVDMDMYMYVQG